MLKSWSNTIFGLAMLCLFGAAAAVPQQDEQNKSSKFESKVEMVVWNQQDSKNSVVVGNGQSIQVEGDQIVIIDANGKKKTIDISGAKNVQVQQSVKTTNHNGKQKSEFRGQAVILLPDGEKQVIEFDGPVGGMLKDNILLKAAELQGLGENEFLFRAGENNVPLPSTLQWTPSKQSKFMIGVHCEPISESLQSHLQLDPGVGLIVQNVTKESPAEKSGVQKHDILVHVGDTSLKTKESLSELVEAAGKNEKELQITAIRKGKEVTLKLLPVERPTQETARFQLQFNEIGPGIVMPKAPDMPSRIRLPKLPKQMNKGMNLPGNFDSEFKAMRKEMERIRKELEELRSDRDK